MDVKLKIATATSVGAIIVAALAITLTPAGASPSQFMWWGDTYDASNKTITEVESKNYIDVDQNASQNASSGGVTASHIDDINGNASTGSASNSANSSVAVAAMNTATVPEMAAAEAPVVSDEYDSVVLSNFTKTEVESKNDVDVNNTVSQSATSGSVSLNCLDDVSGVTTGNASNSATLTTTITASN
jgi:hypothetical protein